MISHLDHCVFSSNLTKQNRRLFLKTNYFIYDHVVFLFGLFVFGRKELENAQQLGGASTLISPTSPPPPPLSPHSTLFATTVILPLLGLVEKDVASVALGVPS